MGAPIYIVKTNRPTLITAEEVLAVAPIETTAADRILINSIVIAEERYIASALGNSLYYDFIAQKNTLVTALNQADLVTLCNNNLPIGYQPITANDIPIGTYLNSLQFVTNTNYIDLWTWYLWNWCAEAVGVQLIVPSWTRTTAQGQQQNNPKSITGNGEDSGTASGKDVQYKADAMAKGNVNALQTRALFWICENIDKFPLYNKKLCDPCQKDGVNTDTTSFIMGVYDKYDKDVRQYNDRQKNRWFRPELGAYDTNISGSGAVPPATSSTPTSHTIQTTAIDGQTLFPYVGQTDELDILNLLSGSTFLSLYINGVLLSVGSNAGQVTGYVGNPQRVEWNTPSTAGDIIQLIYIK